MLHPLEEGTESLAWSSVRLCSPLAFGNACHVPYWLQGLGMVVCNIEVTERGL